MSRPRENGPLDSALVLQALDLANLSKIIPLAKDVESGLAALGS